MIVQIVKFESQLTEDEVMDVAMDRIDEFRAMPGLLQKFYVKLDQPNWYGGIYIWDTMESLSAYRASDLAATIAGVYKVKGSPKIEVMETLTELRPMVAPATEAALELAQ